jgi:hypothetical protein
MICVYMGIYIYAIHFNSVSGNSKPTHAQVSLGLCRSCAFRGRRGGGGFRALEAVLDDPRRSWKPMDLWIGLRENLQETPHISW